MLIRVHGGQGSLYIISFHLPQHPGREALLPRRTLEDAETQRVGVTCPECQSQNSTPGPPEPKAEVWGGCEHPQWGQLCARHWVSPFSKYQS